MASFTDTGLDTSAETLNDGEFGVITDSGELIVEGVDAIVGSGANKLIVNGTLAVISTTDTFIAAYDFDGTDVDIFVGTSGFVIGSSGDAFKLSVDTRVEVINNGTITADFDAVEVTAATGGTAINIANNGFINGSQGLVLNAGTGETVITNTGVISTNFTAIASTGTGNAVLNNSGTITAASGNSVTFNNGSDLIINTGVIIGPVSMGGGNDVFDGREGVQPSRSFVSLGVGDDTYLGSDGDERISPGADEDQVFAGAGNDTIRGHQDSADDLFDGGAGVDLVDYGTASSGLTIDLGIGLAQGGGAGTDQLVSIENVTTGSGQDTVIGSADNNLIRTGGGDDRALGEEGRDRLRGGEGNDTLNGGDGNDFLFGEENDDRLFGDDGKDLLAGGLGRDVMTGGAGVDQFAFFDIADSGTTGGTRDRITDFEQGTDKINLVGVDANTIFNQDQAFDFIGTAAFSGTAGELRFRQSATLTVVEMDIDGDGVADMEIRLDGVINLVANDFVL